MEDAAGDTKASSSSSSELKQNLRSLFCCACECSGYDSPDDELNASRGCCSCWGRLCSTRTVDRVWNKFKSLEYRHFVLFIGVVINLAAGSQYNFSSYSPTLRVQMGYSSTEVTLIATLGNLGLYCGFLIGILYDRVGARGTSIVSGIMVFIGYFVVYLCVEDIIPGPAWLLALFFILVGQGSWGLYEVAILTNMKNFKSNVGKVAGLMASAFGLSSGLYTLIWAGGFSPRDDVGGFIILMASCVVSVSVLSAIFVKVTPEAEGFERIGDAHIAETENEPKKVITDEETEKLVDINTDIMNPTELDITWPQLFVTIDFWLLWVPFLFGAGAGLMMINHLGDLVISLGEDSTTKNILVGMLSISNCTGRLGMGFLSDRYGAKLNKAYWVVLALIIMAVGHFSFFLINSFWYVPILVAMTGVAYGGMFAVVPVLIPAYWGYPHMGINYGFMALAPACGSIALSQLASYLYDREKQDGEESCTGGGCYELAFAVSGGCCFLAAIISFVLAKKRSKGWLN